MTKPLGPWSPLDEWGCVYVIQIEGHPWLKIGYTALKTTDAAQMRVRSMQCGCPLPLRLLKEYPCWNPKSVEWFIHKLFAKHRRIGEWFAVDVDTVTEAFQTAMLQKENHTFFMTDAQKIQWVVWHQRWQMCERIDRELDTDFSCGCGACGGSMNYARMSP